MNNFAGIIINNEAAALDRVFTYKVPEELKEKIDIGFRVKIPFGNGNKVIEGFVTELYDEVNLEYSLKNINGLCDKYPLLSKDDIKLIEFMRNKYLCTYYECIKTIIPPGIGKGISHKIESKVYTSKNLEGKYLSNPYVQIYETVKNNEGKYNKSNLGNTFKFSISSINTLIKHGFLEVREGIVSRVNNRYYKAYEEKILNEEQKSAFDQILSGNHKIYLIHGVTGSGKTEVYMKLVSEAMKKGEDSIILVPEISLTPQMVERFKGRFGNDIAVFHSKLSDGERYDEWIRVKEGKVKVAIGARSAVFLPFKNLGFIIIDEEHEGSYKSDSDPKYNAREIAEFKAGMNNLKVVLGSATPSIETYYRCTKNEINLIRMKHRADKSASLPEIKIIDMREELSLGNKSIFSNLLFNKIQDKLDKKEQIILFLNRRGHSTFVSCRKCGFVFKCSNCDISLTYHNSDNILVCHYCGKKVRAVNLCPKCGSRYVKYFGVGTEKIEQEVNKYFPQGVSIRMDFDTTRKKNSYEEIYNRFKNRNADVLIGTQMIAKGLDFPNVTLVGIIAADLSLNLPDYKSSERTFQLISQVAGRAGRSEKKGIVVVQTYNPEHFSIRYASQGQYEEFFNEEINIRKTMNYPPFSTIMLVNLSSKNENLLIKTTQKIGIKLNNVIKNNDNIEVLGPCPSPISKIKEHYRWQIILKGEIDNKRAREFKNYIYELCKDVYNEIRLSIDINPNSLL